MLAHVYIRTYIRMCICVHACLQLGVWVSLLCETMSPHWPVGQPPEEPWPDSSTSSCWPPGSSLGRVKSPADPLAFPACQSYWGSDPNWDDFMRSCLLWSFLDWGWSGAIIVLPRRKRSSALNRGSRGEWFNESNKSSQQGAEIKSWCFRQPCYAYWPHSCH